MARRKSKKLSKKRVKSRPRGKIRNPKTGRFVKKSGVIGKKILARRKSAKRRKSSRRSRTRKRKSSRRSKKIIKKKSIGLSPKPSPKPVDPDPHLTRELVKLMEEREKMAEARLEGEEKKSKLQEEVKQEIANKMDSGGLEFLEDLAVYVFGGKDNMGMMDGHAFFGDLCKKYFNVTEESREVWKKYLSAYFLKEVQKRKFLKEFEQDYKEHCSKEDLEKIKGFAENWGQE